MRKYSIQNKIIIPFTFLSVTAIIISTFIAITLFNHKYDEKIIQETKQWMRVIFATNYQNEVNKIKQAMGVEIAIFARDNGVIVATFSEKGSQKLAETIKIDEARRQIEHGEEMAVMDVQYLGESYKVFCYPLKLYQRMYCFMRPMSEVQTAKRQVTYTTLIIAASVILLVILIGTLIAKNLTAPIHSLVEFTRKVGEGNLELQAEISTSDELGELAQAFNDMTDELLRYRNELVHVERLATAGKMSATFAHEIRNPLSSIKMLLQLLKKKANVGNDKQSEKYIESIIEEVDRVDMIVDGMMDFAQPAELNLKKCDINELIKSVLELMQGNLEHQKIELKKMLDLSLPGIKADPNKLKQVFMNLVLNAIQAMPEGGMLTVSTHQTDSAIEIEFEDTGVGISDDNLKLIFEPFFTTKRSGTGLGLANAKRIIEQHNGEISIQSKIDTGTSVFIRLQEIVASARLRCFL